MNPLRAPAILLATLLIATLAACGASGPTPAPTLGPRPSSSATVEVVQPAQGATVGTTAVHIEMELVGGRIVTETTTTITPEEGHVHLYIDNLLVSMNYGLEQDVTLTVGSHAIKAEFVAADHAPFNPRVWSPVIVVTAK